MGVKTCPECGLLVDERHQLCGCGYDWADEPNWRAGLKKRLGRPLSPTMNVLIVLFLGFTILPIVLVVMMFLVAYGCKWVN